MNPNLATKILLAQVSPIAQPCYRTFRQTSVFVLLTALRGPLRAQDSHHLNEEVAELRAIVDGLQARVAELETRAAWVLKNAPDPEEGKRWGARLDLQCGQATQSLQGKTATESRPELNRGGFQAYGTLIVPLAKDSRWIPSGCEIYLGALNQPSR
jgi:hypothetical protein